MLFHFQYSEARSVGHHKYVFCLICSIARPASVNEASVSFFSEGQIPRLPFLVVFDWCFLLTWPLGPGMPSCTSDPGSSKTWASMPICFRRVSDLGVCYDLMNWWKWLQASIFQDERDFVTCNKKWYCSLGWQGCPFFLWWYSSHVSWKTIEFWEKSSNQQYWNDSAFVHKLRRLSEKVFWSMLRSNCRQIHEFFFGRKKLFNKQWKDIVPKEWFKLQSLESV